MVNEIAKYINRFMKAINEEIKKRSQNENSPLATQPMTNQTQKRGRTPILQKVAKMCDAAKLS